MELDKKRKELTKYIEIIKQIINNGANDSDIKERIDELEQDIKDDMFTVLVLGEFKRGKSTFVNALLGESLMITDVLPETATIQAIMYSNEKKAQVVMKNGSKKEGAATKEFFNEYSAKNINDTEEIQYIKVGYPCELLKNNIVLVDTPGVAEMNEQRVNVTYNFLPKANAVIFVLDAMSPLKRSERDFINEYLLGIGIDRVIFVLNKVDLLDEDEIDVDEHVESVRQRIREAFSESGHFREPIVIPVESYTAVEGYETNNNELIEKSNINNVKNTLMEVLFGGNVEAYKLESHKSTLLNILEQWKNQYEIQRNMLLQSSSELDSQLNAVMELQNDRSQKYAYVENYVKNQVQVLISMTDKSLDKFREDLIEDIMYELDRYYGQNFKEFIERDIPHIMRKKTDMWLQSHLRHIEKFYDKLEDKLSYGLTVYFKTKVRIYSDGEEVDIRPFIDLEAKNSNVATIEAGAVTAAGVIIMSLVGLGAFAPLVSMAALPYMRDAFLKDELTKLKDQIRPEIISQIDNHILYMKSEIEKNIFVRVDNLTYNLRNCYDRFLSLYEKNTRLCIEQKNEQESQISQTLNTIDNNYSIVKSLIEKTLIL